jgi:Glycosyl hydrolases family 39
MRTSVKVLYLLFPMILLVCCASASLAQTPSGSVPSTFFGMHIENVSDWPSVPIGALGKGAGVAWPYVEPSRGEFDWTRLDDYVDTASAHGIATFYSTAYVPEWAASDTSSCSDGSYGIVCTSGITNIEDWENFVTALVTRYKGRIQIYELWNEPDHMFTGTMAQLVSLTNAEDSIIRSLDPTATILSPSIVTYDSSYFASYLAAGGTKNIDVVSMHGCPSPTNDVAEFILASASTSMRAVMQEYGLSAKPLWDTEGTWGYESDGAITNAELRAAYIAQDYLLHWSVGITRLYWFAWDDSNDGTLWSPTSGTSEAGIAYGQVYKWMVGATMAACSLNGSTNVYDALYTCKLTRSGGYEAEAVWWTQGSETYTAPSEYTKYQDLAGNVYTIASNHEVTIGREPILLENEDIP